MIVTFTPNPSLDRTARVSHLTRGGVHRLTAITTEPGGKGVNVARAVHLAGQPTLAVVPAARHDPLLEALRALRLSFRHVDIDARVRTNLTLTEADGTTTKLNEPGAPVTAEQVELLTDMLVGSARSARWVAMSGSLPPGAPPDWYPQIVRALRPLGVRIAVDTSDAPLKALAGRLDDAAPDLVKPNSEELAQLVNDDPTKLEAAADRGDLEPVLAAARTLTDRGVGAALVTLGGSGALLVTRDGAWHAAAPPVTVASTVGAGDSSLAGYLMADCAGLSAPDLLAHAVAYGSAAAALPGSALPCPQQARPSDVTVTAL